MNYWIFQYTTKVYKNAIEDFKNEVIKTWEVNKHKRNIKKGDMAIIYIGGGKGKGVYGVAKLTSEIYYNPEKQKNYIDINIIENWSENPISFYRAKEKIPDLLIGISGTNFRSDNIQYNKLKKLL